MIKQSNLCWHCGKALTDLPNRISFRETCPYCQAYLHCCKNCVNYAPGQPNDCRIPGTDPISDREAANFCEEFVFLGQYKPPSKDQNRFQDLFKPEF